MRHIGGLKPSPRPRPPRTRSGARTGLLWPGAAQELSTSLREPLASCASHARSLPSTSRSTPVPSIRLLHIPPPCPSPAPPPRTLHGHPRPRAAATRCRRRLLLGKAV
eukprot:747943-Hanusia_phi.AAC.3